MTWRKWVPFALNPKWKWKGWRRELANRFLTKRGDCIQVDPRIHEGGPLLAVVHDMQDDGVMCHSFRQIHDAALTTAIFEFASRRVVARKPGIQVNEMFLPYNAFVRIGRAVWDVAH